MNEFLNSEMFSVLLAAMGVAVILPMIDAYGIAISHVPCAVLIWISYGYVVVSKETKIDLLLMTTNSGLYNMVTK